VLRSVRSLSSVLGLTGRAGPRSLGLVASPAGVRSGDPAPGREVLALAPEPGGGGGAGVLGPGGGGTTGAGTGTAASGWGGSGLGGSELPLLMEASAK
jgi:hypothetical protein